MSSRISGRNRSTSHSPNVSPGKAAGINSPNYAAQKRNVYGQYRNSPNPRAKIDDPEYHKTPRQKAVFSNPIVMTERASENVVLVP